MHCNSEHDAKSILRSLEERFKECLLELHPEKTKIVYCKDANRKMSYPNTMFTFLGYDFRRRIVKAKKGKNLFLSFTPAVSKVAQKAMRMEIRKTRLSSKTELSLEEIAAIYNPILRGWLEYYGHYTSSALYPVLRHFNMTLVKWAIRKYKKLKRGKTRATIIIQKIMEKKPGLFAHWKLGMIGAFA